MLLVSTFLIAVNIQFYGNIDWKYADLARSAFIGFSILWAAIMLYIFPFFLEQKKPGLILAFRNSAVLLFRAPLQTLGILVIVAAIFYFSTFHMFILWIFISMFLITYLSNRVAIQLMNKYRQDEPTDESEDEARKE